MTTPLASTTSTEGPPVRRVGFIGLGDQGAPIAERIAMSGFPLDVWARRPDAGKPFIDLGAEVIASAPELGRRCDVVLLCVTDDDSVIEVVHERGLLDAMAAGSVLVIHSTVAPATCVEIGASASRRGIDVLDAPVSGGRAGATRGELSVMVGGDEHVLARIRPVLDAYAAATRHVGHLGSGQAAKLINNGLFVANVAMANRALELGRGFGLDPEALAELLSTSSGASAGLRALGPLTTTEWGAHAWSVLRKDVALLQSITGGEPDAQGLVEVAAASVERFSNGG